MRVLLKNFKEGIVKLLVQNSDDLWYLSHIVSKGDAVSGTTDRKISVNEKSAERKKIFAKIEAEKADFSEFADTLRISGKITESGDKLVPMGEHQSFSVSPGDTITIEKTWTVADKEYLERSANKGASSQLLIVSCDYGDATFAYYHEYGLENAGSLSEELGGKKELKSYEKNREAFVKLLLAKINEAAKEKSVPAVLIGGAGMITDKLAAEVKGYDYIKNKTTFVKVGYSGMNGINELVRKGELSKLIQDSLYSEHARMVEKLLEAIAKEGNATYAFSHVKLAVEKGAVSQLLITTNFIKKSKEEKSYDELDKLLRLAESSGGKIHILNSKTENGATVDNLSGIAALTRYKIE